MTNFPFCHILPRPHYLSFFRQVYVDIIFIVIIILNFKNI